MRAVLVGRCATADEVYALVALWTGLEPDTLAALLWQR